jgi:hypothetical protein
MFEAIPIGELIRPLLEAVLAKDLADPLLVDPDPLGDGGLSNALGLELEDVVDARSRAACRLPIPLPCGGRASAIQRVLRLVCPPARSCRPLLVGGGGGLSALDPFQHVDVVI